MLPRLQALAQAARALSGKVGEQKAAHGAGKEATAAEHAAVAEQKEAWSACHRILAAVGEEYPRLKDLLRSAAQK